MKKLDPKKQAILIKKDQEKEKKRHESHLKMMQKAESKMTPKQKAQNHYKNTMNMLGHGKTKKDVEEAKKALLAFGN